MIDSSYWVTRYSYRSTFLELLQDAGVRGNTLVNQHFSDLRITFEYISIKWEATGPWQRFFWGKTGGRQGYFKPLVLLGYDWKLN